MQIRNDGPSHPTAAPFEIRDGDIPSFEAPSRDIGPIKRGGWVDYVVHVKFSNTPTVGFAEMYQNKVLVVPKHFRKTMSSASSYLKMGAYRDAVEQATAIVWQDGLRVTAP